MAGERTPPETHLSPWEKRRPPREGPRGPSDRHRQPPRQPRSPRPGGTRNPPAGRGGVGVGVGGRRDFSPPPEPPTTWGREARRDAGRARGAATRARPAMHRPGSAEGRSGRRRTRAHPVVGVRGSDRPPAAEGRMDGWMGWTERAGTPERCTRERANGRSPPTDPPARREEGGRRGGEGEGDRRGHRSPGIETRRHARESERDKPLCRGLTFNRSQRGSCSATYETPTQKQVVYEWFSARFHTNVRSATGERAAPFPAAPRFPGRRALRTGPRSRRAAGGRAPRADARRRPAGGDGRGPGYPRPTEAPSALPYRSAWAGF